MPRDLLYGDDRLLIPCDCAGTCSYLVLERDLEEDGFYADIYTVPRRATLGVRLRNAYRSLLGRETYEPGMVIRRPQAMELRAWLNEHPQLTE